MHGESFYPEGNCPALRWNDQEVADPCRVEGLGGTELYGRMTGGKSA